MRQADTLISQRDAALAPWLCLRAGAYCVREAASEAEVSELLALRSALFRNGRDDRDAFDTSCRHIRLEDATTGALLGGFRLFEVTGAQIEGSYAAQFYDVMPLRAYPGRMLEVGRFCIRPEAMHSDLVRLAWGGLAQAVDRDGVALLFGCSSFAGTDPAPYGAALAHLGARHLGPERWRPRRAADHTVALGQAAPAALASAPSGLTQMPPLLRSYLAMGGWVSDHAVIDQDLGTLHVFTALEIACISPARARALRAVAGL